MKNEILHFAEHANQYGPLAKGLLAVFHLVQSQECERELTSLLPQLNARYSPLEKEVRFENGAVLMLRVCDTRDSFYRLAGYEFTWIKASDRIDSEIIQRLRSRLRALKANNVELHFGVFDVFEADADATARRADMATVAGWFQTTVYGDVID